MVGLGYLSFRGWLTNKKKKDIEITYSINAELSTKGLGHIQGCGPYFTRIEL